MGPRQDAGEDNGQQLKNSRIKYASMGPRQDAGEDNIISKGRRMAKKGFNGAPAGCRGRLPACHLFPCAVNELQWGPGRMPGKTRERHARHHRRGDASMGPRQDAGEDPVPRGAWCRRRSGFNGAPAGCRGRRNGSILPHSVSVASMGPRQDAGEDLLGCADLILR